MILIQGTYDISIDLLWVTFLILIVQTILLLGGSLYLRAAHNRIDLKISALEDHFYPIVLDYLEGTVNKEKVLAHLSGRKIEYSIFEKVVKELLQQLEGDEFGQLKTLLDARPLFDFHKEQLSSRSSLEIIKACDYFGQTHLRDKEVLKKLRHLYRHDNRLVAYSAASAMMGSSNVELRAEALNVIAGTFRISEMAVLELLYKFRNAAEEQIAEEVSFLRKLILSDRISPGNRAVLILGVSEINYPGLEELFYSLLQSEDPKWNYIRVKEALILAQGYYYNMNAVDDLLPYLQDKRRPIRRAAAEVLSKFQSDRIIKILVSNYKEEDNEWNLFLTESLMKEGCEASVILEAVPEQQREDIEAIIKMVEYELA